MIFKITHWALPGPLFLSAATAQDVRAAVSLVTQLPASELIIEATNLKVGAMDREVKR